MRYVLVLCLALLASCQSCGTGTPVQVAQSIAPNNGFHVLASAGGELQVYPHALYYSGQGRASVTLAYRGRAVHTLEFEPGAAQFRLVEVDDETSRVRLLAATCSQAHALGHLTWIPCEDRGLTGAVQGPARVILEYDTRTGATTR